MENKNGIPVLDKNTDTKDANADMVANLEKRLKDTQAAFTKKAQEAAALRAEVKVLRENSVGQELKLTDDVKAELEELKLTDPDAWYTKKSALERQQKDSLQETINAEVKSLTDLEMRQIVLKEFQQANPDIILTDDVIALDIPPRITQQLKDGSVSFGEFLVMCKDYLKSNKVVGDGNTTLNQPNLTKVGGNNKLNDVTKPKDTSKIVF